MTPREVKKSANAVRNAIGPSASKLDCGAPFAPCTGICNIGFQPASRARSEGRTPSAAYLRPSARHPNRWHSKVSRRQFAAIAGWSILGGSAAAGSGRAEAAASSGFPSGILWGTATSAYQIEGAVNEDAAAHRSGTACPYAWDHFRPQQCRHRNRPLSSVPGRRSADESARRKGLSFLDCVAACLPEGAAGQTPRASISTTGWWMSCSRTASSRLRPCTIGTCLRRFRIAPALDLPRYPKGLCGLCGLRRAAFERSRETLFHDQGILPAGSTRAWTWR